MKKLIIRNLKEFFEQDFERPFVMLGELEEKIKNSNEILQTILVPYKAEGDAIFELIKIEYSKKTIYTYHFSNTIS